MGNVLVENIKVYAYHGCLKEEANIGSDYSVNVLTTANLERASNTDDLIDTVDYVHINHIVKQEMAIRSKLLEHVAQRIITRIFKEISLVSEVKVAVSKINPPIGGDVEKVTIKLQQQRN